MSLNRVSFVEQHQFCLAKFANDGLIYRARFIERDGPNFIVSFVDYGNVDTVDEIFEWSNECYQLPLQAHVLKLLGIGDVVSFARMNNVSEVENKIEEFFWRKLYTVFKAEVS